MKPPRRLAPPNLAAKARPSALYRQRAVRPRKGQGSYRRQDTPDCVAAAMNSEPGELPDAVAAAWDDEAP